jgi:hypothetical protein
MVRHVVQCGEEALERFRPGHLLDGPQPKRAQGMEDAL